MTCTDYTCQPPPSTSTPTATTDQNPFPPMHPVTGADVAPVAVLAGLALLFGTVFVVLSRKLRRLR